MTTGMDYELPYKSDSTFSYEVEEGELSSGSGRSSPGTVRDNASDCGTQTDDQMENISGTVTTMRVHLDNTPKITQTHKKLHVKSRINLTTDGTCNPLTLTKTLMSKEQVQIFIAMNIGD